MMQGYVNSNCEAVSSLVISNGTKGEERAFLMDGDKEGYISIFFDECRGNITNR